MGSGTLESAQWAEPGDHQPLLPQSPLEQEGLHGDKSGDNGATQSGEDIKSWGFKRLIDGSGLPLDRLCGLEQDKPCWYRGAAQCSAVNPLQPLHNFRGADLHVQGEGTLGPLWQRLLGCSLLFSFFT